MKRRDFLTTTSMAVLAHVIGEEVKCKAPLRVAVIGLGHRGMDVFGKLFTIRQAGRFGQK